MKEDNKPLVSVIIPIYNVEEYLQECLNSVISQTYKNIEIICINDGSKDNSLNVLKTFENKDKRFIIIDQENKGVGIARNKGIEKAKGKYLTFIDPDDFFNDLTSVEKMVEAAEKDNLDYVVTNYNYYDDLNQIPIETYNYKTNLNSEKIGKVFYIDEYPKTAFQLTIGIVWAALYRTDFIVENKIEYSNYRFGQDTLFNIHTLICNPKTTILDELYSINYRQNRDGNAESKRNHENFEDLFKLLNEFKNLVDKSRKTELLEETLILSIFRSIKALYIRLESKEDLEKFLELTKENLPKLNITKKQRFILKPDQREVFDDLEKGIKPKLLIGKNQNLRIKNLHLEKTILWNKSNFQQIARTRNYFLEKQRLLKFKFSKPNKFSSFFLGSPIYKKSKIFTNPKVSIIGTFNPQNKEIHKWLDSVQNQTENNIEIICITNNDNKYNCQKIFKKYSKYDKRIRLEIDDNQTKDIQIKNATLAAKGEYIIYLDDKQLLYQNSVKTAYNTISNKKLDFLIYGIDVYSKKQEFDKKAQEKYNTLNAYKLIKEKDFESLKLINSKLLKINISQLIIENKLAQKSIKDLETQHSNPNYKNLLLKQIIQNSNKAEKMNKNLVCHSFEV